jgi:hypothetical protein
MQGPLFALCKTNSVHAIQPRTKNVNVAEHFADRRAIAFCAPQIEMKIA